MKKIFSKKNLKYYVGIGAASMIIIPTTLLVVSLTTNKRNFVLANYQSYMSPNVQKELNNKYGLDYDYFENIEGAKKFLTSNTADIICTTPYEAKKWAEQDLIEKIQWDKFGGNKTLEYITPVTQILESYEVNGTNLLDYGVPYFGQELVFCYRGEEIPELSSSSITWSDVLKIISKNDRFKPKNNKPNLIMLDDQRTIYSIPRSIQTNQLGINPENNSSIETLSETYSILSNYLLKLGRNSLKLNSDSNAVLNEIVEGNVNGGFMFSGDAIYASWGGDFGEDNAPEDIHVVKPIDSLSTVDILVINKKSSDYIKNKIYNVLNDLCFKFNPNDNPEQSILYKNFEYVNYTIPLKSAYDFVIDENYFDGNIVGVQAFEMSNVTPNKLEHSIDDFTKSNMSFSWINFKSKFGV